MKTIAPFTIALLLGIQMYGQEAVKDGSVYLNTKKFRAAHPLRAAAAVPENFTDKPLPDDRFAYILKNNISLVAGLGTGSTFKSKAEVSLVDDPGLKLNFNFGQKNWKSDADDMPFFYGFGVEINSPTNLLDNIKAASPDFNFKISHTGMVFFKSATRFKYYGDKMTKFNADRAAAYGTIANAPAQDKYVVKDFSSGDQKYTLIKQGQQFSMVTSSSSNPDIMLQDYDLKAPFNTKKFHWLSYEIKGGYSQYSYYYPIQDKIKVGGGGSLSLDVSYNFFHFTNPEAVSPFLGWGGTKYIKTGFTFAYALASVSDNSYLNYGAADTLKQNRQVTITKALDSTIQNKYNAYLTWHNDAYFFLDKKKIVGLRFGIDTRFNFDTIGKYDYKKRVDVNLRAGLAFSIPKCIGGDCSDDDAGSFVNFEIYTEFQNLAHGLDKYKNETADDKKEGGSYFKQFGSINVKVGIPFSLMK